MFFPPVSIDFFAKLTMVEKKKRTVEWCVSHDVIVLYSSFSFGANCRNYLVVVNRLTPKAKQLQFNRLSKVLLRQDSFAITHDFRVLFNRQSSILVAVVHAYVKLDNAFENALCVSIFLNMVTQAEVWENEPKAVEKGKERKLQIIPKCGSLDHTVVSNMEIFTEIFPPKGVSRRFALFCEGV